MAASSSVMDVGGQYQEETASLPDGSPRAGVTAAGSQVGGDDTGRALPQGDQRILLEPRASRRLSSQTPVDVRVSRAIYLSGSTRVELLVDVFNALNDAAEGVVATDHLFSPGLGAAFIDPRRAMVGVRLNLGR